MRKKSFVLLLPVILFSFVLVSCGKKPAISAKEAGSALVDAFIYQKESKSFKDNFKDGDALLEAMKKDHQTFTNDFANSLAAQNLAKDKANEISNLLESELKNKTSYQVEVKNEEKGKATVSYAIKGLSYDTVITNILTQLIDASKKDSNLVKNEAQMLQFIAEKLPEAIRQVTTRKEAVTVLMELEVEKGKWKVEKDENSAFQEIFLAFITGVTNAKEFENQMKDAMNEINQNLKNDLGQQK